MITSMAFTVYPVSNMERARAFYEHVLGLLVSHSYRDVWLEYDLGDSTFAITTTASEEPRTMPPVDLAGLFTGKNRDRLDRKALREQYRITDLRAGGRDNLARCTFPPSRQPTTTGRVAAAQ